MVGTSPLSHALPPCRCAISLHAGGWFVDCAKWLARSSSSRACVCGRRACRSCLALVVFLMRALNAISWCLLLWVGEVTGALDGCFGGGGGEPLGRAAERNACVCGRHGSATRAFVGGTLQVCFDLPLVVCV